MAGSNIDEGTHPEREQPCGNADAYDSYIHDAEPSQPTGTGIREPAAGDSIELADVGAGPSCVGFRETPGRDLFPLLCQRSGLRTLVCCEEERGFGTVPHLCGVLLPEATADPAMKDSQESSGTLTTGTLSASQKLAKSLERRMKRYVGRKRQHDMTFLAASTLTLTSTAGSGESHPTTSRSSTEGPTIDFIEAAYQHSRNPEHHSQQSKCHLLEVYCNARIKLATAVIHRCRRAKRFTLADGDLSTWDGQQQLFRLIKEIQPLHIWCAFPCAPWSTLQSISASRSIAAAIELDRKQQEHIVYLELSCALFVYQTLYHRHFHGEQPATASSAQQPAIVGNRIVSCYRLSLLHGKCSP